MPSVGNLKLNKRRHSHEKHLENATLKTPVMEGQAVKGCRRKRQTILPDNLVG